MSTTEAPKSEDAVRSVESALILPPYGYVNADYQWDEDFRRVPEGFLLDGAVATPRQWEDFVQSQVGELADFLWPRYDQKAGKWRGLAAQHAQQMTVRSHVKIRYPTVVGCDMNGRCSKRALFG